MVNRKSFGKIVNILVCREMRMMVVVVECLTKRTQLTPRPAPTTATTAAVIAAPAEEEVSQNTPMWFGRRLKAIGKRQT